MYHGNATATLGLVSSVNGTANRITSTGGTTPVIDISASYVGQTSITTLGTIVSGVWNGSTVQASFGGTGSQFVQFAGPIISVKTFTLPNASDTIAVLGQNQTFTGVNTFNSGGLAYAGATSGTTVLNASAVASGILTLPAATDTLVARATTDSLTNKTLTGATNTISASQFRTSSASPANDVIVTSTTPSGAGQALITTSTTTATWQTLTTGTVISVSGTANRITSTGGATPVIDISAAYVGQTSITTLGTVTTGTWTGTAIAAANGGTGQTSYAIGDMLYASTTSALSKLADVAAGSYLRSGGVTTAPLWSTLVLPNTASVGDMLMASSANTITSLADVAVGNALISGGVGVIPSWGKISLTTTVSGTLPIANGGTNGTTATAGFNNLSPVTTKGDVITSDGTNNVRLAVGSNGQVLVSDSTQTTGLKWTSNASTQSTPADPSTTTSTTGVMMGLAGSITPVITGIIIINICGSLDNNNANDGVAVTIRTGTGTAPANGAALTGTATGATITHTNQSTTARFPFSICARVAGLTVGTAVWIDLGVAAVTGGTARVRDICIVSHEI